MIHIALHFVIPVLVGLLAYRARWRRAALLMVATMVVDLDHLLAVPIYDPLRCSLDAHPLHSGGAILLYALAFAVPLIIALLSSERRMGPRLWTLQVIGSGLLVHMALDWSDCADLFR